MFFKIKAHIVLSFFFYRSLKILFLIFLDKSFGNHNIKLNFLAFLNYQKYAAQVRLNQTTVLTLQSWKKCYTAASKRI